MLDKMKKTYYILIAIFIFSNGCLFYPNEITEEEREKIPNIHKMLNAYSENQKTKARFYFSKPKHLRNRRCHLNVICYNITNKNEIKKIIDLIHNAMRNAPSWYFVNIKFYEKEHFITHGNVSIRDEKLICEKIIYPEKKKKKKKIQQNLSS